MKIEIPGARKYKDKQSVADLVNAMPIDNQIITSRCKGVCTWVKETAEMRRMEVILFEPDLSEIRAWFEVPKRYYQRNKETVEACDLLHAFISAEDGYTAGTRFEVEYAVTLNIPSNSLGKRHLSMGFSIFIPFWGGKQAFFLAWEEFFCKTKLEIGG